MATGAVDVQVVGARNENGKVLIAVYDSDSTFNNRQLATLKKAVPVSNGKASWQIELSRLPKEFAVAAFHDENNDGQLNRNPLGIPSESYGFSRDARGLTGPPSYKQAAMKRPDTDGEIQISIR